MITLLPKATPTAKPVVGVAVADMVTLAVVAETHGLAKAAEAEPYN